MVSFKQVSMCGYRRSRFCRVRNTGWCRFSSGISLKSSLRLLCIVSFDTPEPFRSLRKAARTPLCILLYSDWTRRFECSYSSPLTTQSPQTLSAFVNIITRFWNDSNWHNRTNNGQNSTVCPKNGQFNALSFQSHQSPTNNPLISPRKKASSF